MIHAQVNETHGLVREDPILSFPVHAYDRLANVHLLHDLCGGWPSSEETINVREEIHESGCCSCYQMPSVRRKAGCGVYVRVASALIKQEKYSLNTYLSCQ